jgi:1-phosphofructokinase family hexose kinase
LVLSLNPAVDLEWIVPVVRWNEKNTIEAERRWAGGKGVNVARWLRHLGGRVELLIPLGGAPGEELGAALRREKIPARIISLREATRVDAVVTAADGRQLRFNPRGPRLSKSEWSRLEKEFVSLLKQSRLLVISGSMPPGAPVDLYARWTRKAEAQGLQVLADCDGVVFASAVKARPFLVKPNAHELAQWIGKPLRGIKDLRAAAMTLAQVTGGWVAVSRGPQAAWLLRAENNEFYQATPPAMEVQTTNGAGDAMLAGMAGQILRNEEPGEWLRHGVAAGVAATQCPAGTTPTGEVFERCMEKIQVK